MATPLYRSSIDPSFLLNLQAIDVGDLVSPDGRSHPITGLSSVQEFTGSSSAVGLDATPTPVATGPSYTPGVGTTPGGGTPGTQPTWGDIYRNLIENISGGTLTTSTGTGVSQAQATGTRFGIPHFGVRIIVAIVGIGILLIVAARLAFKE